MLLCLRSAGVTALGGLKVIHNEQNIHVLRYRCTDVFLRILA